MLWTEGSSTGEIIWFGVRPKSIIVTGEAARSGPNMPWPVTLAEVFL